MRPEEMLQSVKRYLEDSDPSLPPVLAQAAVGLADMVSWSPGPIDPGGQFIKRLDTLQNTLRVRYDQFPDNEVAALHDALADLKDAVVRHDGDFTRQRMDDDDTIEL